MQEQTRTRSIAITGGFVQKMTDFGLLIKFKLSLTVLFSAVMSYAIVAEGQAGWLGLLLLAAGGFMVTGSANALNQVLEREYDRLMARTANRPVAAGRMSISSAVLIAGLMALLGITLLTLFNSLAGFLGTLSLLSYAFVYTPMKRVSPWAVAVGALPGALPLIIGSVAWEGFISQMAFMLFTLQFLWQFPHFWAVAWLADEDYKKAGFYLLPSKNGQKDKTTGVLSLVFCGALMVNAGMGYALGLTSLWATAVLMLLNGFFAWRCWQLLQTCSREAARRQMFASLIHLPLSLIVILIDKF